MARKTQPRMALSVAAAQSLPNRTNNQLRGVYEGRAVRRRDCCHANSRRDPSPQVARASLQANAETAQAPEVAPISRRPEPYWQSGRDMRYDPFRAKDHAEKHAKSHIKNT
jgi:hypothetical protein